MFILLALSFPFLPIPWPFSSHFDTIHPCFLFQRFSHTLNHLLGLSFQEEDHALEVVSHYLQCGMASVALKSSVPYPPLVLVFLDLGKGMLHG
jgi:hypothetical protein